MQLSKKTIPQSNELILSVPQPSCFELPEKVLQFGTGVLLRGLPDYFIDKANKQGIFNGRIVMVKSTDSGGTDAYNQQDGLFTQCVKGILNQEMTEEYIINASISRVLSARSQWRDVLGCAANPDLELIISNTTEVGIVLEEDDNLKGNPPVSFPGKLLSFLYERYKAFNADENKGLVIVPTELIIDNGNKLLSILMELAHLNKFDYAFIDWLETANRFCNSLVDRIVPGKLPAAEQKAVEEKLGYSDELMIMSEPYRLWAIESSDPIVKKILSFAKTDAGVVITSDISKYRELKLRLLNGTHTFTCGLAHLAGFKIVKEGMKNKTLSTFVHDLMLHEIAPCVVKENLPATEVYEFANKVIERFRNPFLDHKLISITLQYSNKMKMRNVPLLEKHYQQDLDVPAHMALGFAAFLLFMKCELGEDGKYYGKANNVAYPVQDEQAEYFSRLWQNNKLKDVVGKTLGNLKLWGTDLTSLPGFAFAVEFYLDSIIQRGVMVTLKEYEVNRVDRLID